MEWDVGVICKISRDISEVIGLFDRGFWSLPVGLSAVRVIPPAMPEQFFLFNVPNLMGTLVKSDWWQFGDK